MKRAAKMPRYVWSRPETHVLWFRMSVPKKVRDRVGKAVFQCSLGTTDIRRAAALAQDKRNQLMREWGLLDPVAPPSMISLSQLAAEIGFDKYFAALGDARRNWPSSTSEYEARLEQIPITRKLYTRDILDGDLARWEPAADKRIAEHGLSLGKGTPEYVAFVGAIAEATIDALGVFHRQMAGDLSAQPTSAVVAKAKEIAKGGETLLELFELWAGHLIAICGSACKKDPVSGVIGV